MSKFTMRVAIIVLATALSATAYAAQKAGSAGGVSGYSGGHGVSGYSGGHGFSGYSGSHGFSGYSGSHGVSGYSGSHGASGYSGSGGHRLSAGLAISHSSVRSISRHNRSLAVHNTSRALTKSNAVHNAKLNANVKSNTVRKALNSNSIAGALKNKNALHNQHTRAGITASAALAGHHHGRHGGNGWWRHRNGGYGWVGPLYWPFAYYDMDDYFWWGDDYDDAFWGYGYGDIYVGMFAPYGYDDLTGYLPEYASAPQGTTGVAPPASATPSAATSQLAQMCGEDSHDIAGLPIDQFQQAIQPTEAQRAALDDLANASLKAAQDIKVACPTDIALTAPSRLAAMQQRIEAMIAAVATVQPPLEKFYGLLSDEQKARLTALGNDQRQNQPAEKPAGSLAKSCGTSQPGVTEWPTAEIDRAVRPTEAQRASLATLQNASAKAADMLKASCQPDNALTPPARLAAVGKRLDVMLQAVKTVRSALNDFYGALNDEQKARFEAIGPQQMSQLDQPSAAQAHVRRHRRHRSRHIGSLFRHLIVRF
jgi:hypothetical protein